MKSRSKNHHFRRRGNLLWPIMGLATLLLISPSGLAFFQRAAEVLPVDDAYHYDVFADGRHDRNYIEWWYFNFFDAEQDIQAIFTYFVADPENLTGHGLAQLASVVYTSQGTVSAIDVYPLDAFSASYDQADVRIGAGSLRVINEETYRIIGTSKEGSLSWDLTYVRRAAPFFAADRIAVGRFPWERMSWLTYMPGADVSGRVEVGGRVYVITSSGYHDHNWGEWIVSDALWSWAQYFEPGLAVEMGDFRNTQVGILSIEVDGERTVFTRHQYQLSHTDWALDAENRKRYPTETGLRAESATKRLTLSMNAIKTHPLRGDLPFPLPDVIII